MTSGTGAPERQKEVKVDSAIFDVPEHLGPGLDLVGVLGVFAA
jgi:hypothetical protein